MQWFTQLFAGHGVAPSIVALSLTAALGLGIGLIQFKGIRLRAGGVLFSGLALAHFGISVERGILEFVRESGLIIFLFAVGMQVGPALLESLRRRGLLLNLSAACIIFLGVLTTAAVFHLFGLSMPVAVGLFSGAVTNTPSLSAATQVFKETLAGSADEAIASAGVAYATAYPFGILGVIFVMLLVRWIFRIDPEKESDKLTEFSSSLHPPLQSGTFTVNNPAVFGMTVKKFRSLHPEDFAFCYLKTPGDNAILPGPHVRFTENMLVRAIGKASSLAGLRELIGPASFLTPYDDPDPLESRRILISRSGAAGKSLEVLGLTPESGLAATRIVRAGVERIALPGSCLHYGDALICLGEASALDRAESVLGNSAKALEQPHVLPLFAGIFLAVVFGSIPLAIPGLPPGIKLGLASGSLLTAITLSRVNNFAGMVWYLPSGAGVILRDVGLALFLACVGLNSGAGFVDTLVRDSGLTWLAAGACITFFPLLLAALLTRVVFKYDYPTICGLLSGSMTDTPALTFSVQMLGSDAPSAAYATVYPLTTILRMLSAQFLALGLSQTL